MCNQRRPINKFQKFRENLFNRRRIHHHLIRNTGKPGNFKRNRHFRIYKGTELIRNLSFFHLYRADFNNLILYRTKTRSLQIKYHISITKLLAFFINCNILQIINQICFYTINNLKGILLLQPFNVMVSVCETLYDAMIRNGNCRVSPIMRPLYNLRHIRDAIHITHFGMTVKFYPLLHRFVFPYCRKILNFLNAIHRTYGKLSVISVNRRDPFDFQKSTRLNLWQHLIFHKHFHHNGIGKIRHRIHENGFFSPDFPGLKTNHLTTDCNLTHLTGYAFQLNRCIIKISSENHIWII